jgi:hypothetical protein
VKRIGLKIRERVYWCRTALNALLQNTQQIGQFVSPGDFLLAVGPRIYQSMEEPILQKLLEDVERILSEGTDSDGGGGPGRTWATSSMNFDFQY